MVGRFGVTLVGKVSGSDGELSGRSEGGLCSPSGHNSTVGSTEVFVSPPTIVTVDVPELKLKLKFKRLYPEGCRGSTSCACILQFAILGSAIVPIVTGCSHGRLNEHAYRRQLEQSESLRPVVLSIEVRFHLTRRLPGLEITATRPL